MDLSRLMGAGAPPVDQNVPDTAETIHISSLALIKVRFFACISAA